MLNGTVTTAGAYLTPKSFADTNWQIRGVADFNKDGKPDILWHHQKTGDLYVWFLNGTQVTTGAYLTPSRFADTKWQIRAVVDFNKDGEPDLLWHHQVTGRPLRLAHERARGDVGDLPDARAASPTRGGRSSGPRTSTRTGRRTSSGTTRRPASSTSGS